MRAESVWLRALHGEWQRLRGRRVVPGKVAFGMDWEDLLDLSGLRSAEDREAAGREAGEWEREGRLVLARHRYRPGRIGRVRVPLEQEEWLLGLFRKRRPEVLWEAFREVVRVQAQIRNPLHPELWAAMCAGLLAAIGPGRQGRCFLWQDAAAARGRMALLYWLTGKEWRTGTLVRDVSVGLMRDSKALERQQRSVEGALSVMFGRPMTLEALGLVTANSRLLFDGPLTLHFAEGTVDESGGLRHGDSVTAADLERAVAVTTTARRLVSVENSKTTFRQLAARNGSRGTLLFASSFPTGAVRLLLEKLPGELPHWHFGDTDAAGYLILQKLRQVTDRPVRSLAMDWQDAPESPLLTVYDLRVLSRLREAGELVDCQEYLTAMLRAGRKGKFEQEARVLPDLDRLV